MHSRGPVGGIIEGVRRELASQVHVEHAPALSRRQSLVLRARALEVRAHLLEHARLDRLELLDRDGLGLKRRRRERSLEHGWREVQHGERRRWNISWNN